MGTRHMIAVVNEGNVVLHNTDNGMAIQVAKVCVF